MTVAVNHDIRDTGHPTGDVGHMFWVPNAGNTTGFQYGPSGLSAAPHECCLKWLTSWPQLCRAQSLLLYSNSPSLKRKGMLNLVRCYALLHIACAFHTVLLTCRVGSQDNGAEEAHALGAMLLCRERRGTRHFSSCLTNRSDGSVTPVRQSRGLNSCWREEDHLVIQMLHLPHSYATL